jgi:hypothetical protein
MWKRIKNRIFGRSNPDLLKEKCEELQRFRKLSSEIAIFGTPTEGNWLGIANASKSLFPNTAYAFPQVYSNNGFNKKEFETWKKQLVELKFQKITFSGFAYFFFDLIEEIGNNTHVEIIFHGTISEFHSPEKQKWIGRKIQLAKADKINRVGFVKTGMAEVFNKLYGFDCFHAPLPTPEIPKHLEKLKLDRNKFHIGVFGADTFNKNLHNQVIHALLIENAVVHVLDKSIFNYLNQNDRIVEHRKNLSREKFLSILGSMDLNLYMSYSESWGLVAYESEAMGVKCVRIEDINYFKLISDLYE